VRKALCVGDDDLPQSRGVPGANYGCGCGALRRADYGQTLVGHAGLKLLASVRES
jgi:hypothetical protein